MIADSVSDRVVGVTRTAPRIVSAAAWTSARVTGSEGATAGSLRIPGRRPGALSPRIMIVIIVRMAALHDASTRERLLAAAVEVFVEQGYEGARLQDIARAAGLTTGAVYANFRGKDELLFAAIGARAGVEMDALLARRAGREPRELLELLGDQLVRPRRQPPLLIDAVAAARRDDELAAALRERLRRTRARARRRRRAREAPTARSIPRSTPTCSPGSGSRSRWARW